MTDVTGARGNRRFYVIDGRDRMVNGKMIGGFALIAYPAEYGNSGVMTFIVNHKGTVFQKDLGADTAKLAEAMTSFNPDKTWAKVDVTAAAK